MLNQLGPSVEITMVSRRASDFTAVKHEICDFLLCLHDEFRSVPLLAGGMGLRYGQAGGNGMVGFVVMGAKSDLGTGRANKPASLLPNQPSSLTNGDDGWTDRQLSKIYSGE